MSQKSTCEISTVFVLVFPRVCSRPTSGMQLCSSCMITAHQNQWVQSWESIETTFGYLQTPGFSRSISRDKLTPGYHMLMPPCLATFHLAIPCLWLSLRHFVHLLRISSYLFFTLLYSGNFFFLVWFKISEKVCKFQLDLSLYEVIEKDKSIFIISNQRIRIKY